MAAKITQSHAEDRERAAGLGCPERPVRPGLGNDRWWLAATLLVSVLLALGGEPVASWARYERDALEAGQWWRLVSAHFVHLGWSHLVLNLGALALLRGLLGPALGALEWTVLFAMAALTIDAGLYVLSPETEWYVGLSGVLHAVAVVAAAGLLRRERGLGVALLAGLVAKITWEQLAGPSAWSTAASGGPVVVTAHLYGATAGLLSLPILRWLANRPRL